MTVPFVPDATLNKGVDAMLDDVTYVQLHTGDPGSAGTSNVAAGVDRCSSSWGSSSGAQAQASVVWTIPAAGGPYTSWSAWTASTGGTFRLSGDLDPDTTFQTSGSLTATLTVEGSTGSTS